METCTEAIELSPPACTMGHLHEDGGTLFAAGVPFCQVVPGSGASASSELGSEFPRLMLQGIDPPGTKRHSCSCAEGGEGSFSPELASGYVFRVFS